MNSYTQHQPGFRELSGSDIDLVSGGATGFSQLITVQQMKAQTRSFSGQSDISSSYGKTNDALVQNIRG